MENEIKVEWSKDCEWLWKAEITANNYSNRIQTDVEGGVYAIGYVCKDIIPTLIELLTLVRDGKFAPPEPEHIRLLRNAREILKDIPYLPRRENDISCDLRKEIEAYLEKEKSDA